MTNQLKQGQKLLLDWYTKHKRNLPWRSTSNPYLIWISEIVLQQTRVAQGMEYYLKLVDRFPTVVDLATAEADELMKLWQGLGYYSRARNLHLAAKQVVSDFQGIFPNTYTELLTLKGVGPYTAAAIASISKGEAVAVVDGNVERVLSRLYHILEPVNETSGKKLIQQLANSFLNKEQAGNHNQAVMELGALVCTPKSPNCEACPLRQHCQAYTLNKHENLPVKTRKVKQRKRYFNYFFVQHNDFTYMRKRKGGDIWQGLYEPILVETKEKSGDETILHELEKITELSTIEIQNTYPEIKHVLSHQIIMARFFSVKIKEEEPKVEGYERILNSELSNLPVSRLVDKYLADVLRQ